MYFIYLLIAFFAGLGLATQAAINSQLAKSMGDEAIIAALISFAVGTLFLFVIAWWKTDLWQHLSALPQQPAWKFLGGILGAFAVFTTVLLAPKLGISVMLFFIIIGQLISSTTIDYFGLIGMPTQSISPAKWIGLTIIAFGLLFYFFGEKWLHWLSPFKPKKNKTAWFSHSSRLIYKRSLFSKNLPIDVAN